MGKISYKAQAIYGKFPAMGVYTKYLPGGTFDLYGFWEINKLNKYIYIYCTGSVPTSHVFHKQIACEDT